MKTQLELAKEGIVTNVMAEVAKDEGYSEEEKRRGVAAGHIVIPCNPARPGQKVCGIGTGLRTKVNASIGTSSDISDVALEIRKARIAETEKADTLMELSTGGDLDAIRRAVLKHCSLPVGNVPLYQAFAEAGRKYHNPNKLDPEYLFELIERRELEKQYALARRDSDFKEYFRLSMFPEKMREVRDSRKPENQATCTMCGDFCAMERGFALFKDDISGDKCRHR